MAEGGENPVSGPSAGQSGDVARSAVKLKSELARIRKYLACEEGVDVWSDEQLDLIRNCAKSLGEDEAQLITAVRDNLAGMKFTEAADIVRAQRAALDELTEKVRQTARVSPEVGRATRRSEESSLGAAQRAFNNLRTKMELLEAAILAGYIPTIQLNAEEVVKATEDHHHAVDRVAEASRWTEEKKTEELMKVASIVRGPLARARQAIEVAVESNMSILRSTHDTLVDLADNEQEYEDKSEEELTELLNDVGTNKAVAQKRAQMLLDAPLPPEVSQRAFSLMTKATASAQKAARRIREARRRACYSGSEAGSYQVNRTEGGFRPGTSASAPSYAVTGSTSLQPGWAGGARPRTTEPPVSSVYADVIRQLDAEVGNPFREIPSDRSGLEIPAPRARTMDEIRWGAIPGERTEQDGPLPHAQNRSEDNQRPPESSPLGGDPSVHRAEPVIRDRSDLVNPVGIRREGAPAPQGGGGDQQFGYVPAAGVGPPPHAGQGQEAPLGGRFGPNNQQMEFMRMMSGYADIKADKDGWPKFDGKYVSYPSFRREWWAYWESYFRDMRPEILLRVFKEKCISAAVLSVIGGGDSIEEVWASLDACYMRPEKFAAEALEPILQFRKYRPHDPVAIRDLYSALRGAIQAAKRVGFLGDLLTSHTIPLIMEKLPRSDRTQWATARRAWSQPGMLQGTFDHFVDRKWRDAVDTAAMEQSASSLSLTEKSRAKSPPPQTRRVHAVEADEGEPARAFRPTPPAARS